MLSEKRDVQIDFSPLKNFRVAFDEKWLILVFFFGFVLKDFFFVSCLYEIKIEKQLNRVAKSGIRNMPVVQMRSVHIQQ